MGLVKQRTFLGGIHPSEKKQQTEKLATETPPLPPEVIIPLQQHIGAPSEPVVEKGSQVDVGEPLSKCEKFVSVPVHASISGTITSIEERPHPSGMNQLSVIIENDGKDRWRSDIQFDQDYLDLSIDDMRDRIRDAGIAGMGGATFPTHVKLSPPGDKEIDTLIINGAECEPFLTSDHRLMLEEPKKILLGIQIMTKILNVKKIIIAIEKNKPDAIKVMRKNCNEGNSSYRVLGLPVKYPQGAEKQLIYAITRRRVPAGGLPMDIGCVVHNVGTAVAVYDAVAYKRPLVERFVTVAGPGIEQPKNLRLRIGTSYRYVFDYCGGLKESTAEIIMGGPMMGIAQSSLDIPVIKGTSGLLAFEKRNVLDKTEKVCISCARCVDACPMKLMPTTIANYVKHGYFDKADEFNALDCMECGSCAYLCPSHINLVHYIRYGKSEIVKRKKNANVS